MEGHNEEEVLHEDKAGGMEEEEAESVHDGYCRIIDNIRLKT